MKIYTIYDVKSEGYGLPFFAINDAVAIRIVSQSAEDSELGKWPEDFMVCRLGEYSKHDGSFELEKVPFSLGTVLSLQRTMKKIADSAVDSFNLESQDAQEIVKVNGVGK